LRAGVRYDHADSWNGINSYDVTISRGLSTLGASGDNDPDVSRAGAKPDFTKEVFTFSRWQDMGQDVNLMFSAMAQRAPNVLYSSEEIGYGGQVYGRAYDTSELTGNQGVMAMMELRYDGIAPFGEIHSEPYIFYDIGEVWNTAAGQPTNISAASGGIGLRLTSDWHVSADFTAAQPLTRPQSAPIDGSANSPRFLAKILVNY
jgi:hemolysin activation/secretion protein